MNYIGEYLQFGELDLQRTRPAIKRPDSCRECVHHGKADCRIRGCANYKKGRTQCER